PFCRCTKGRCCFWCCFWKRNREPGWNPGGPRHCDRGGLVNEATDPAARDWEGGQPDEARVRRPARSFMREPSGEGESCWLFGTLRLVGPLLKSCLPFVSSRFSILNPEYSQSRVRRSYAPNPFCLSSRSGGGLNSFSPSFAEFLPGSCIAAVRWCSP